MDKIPAALQHKIDYINALDIPDKSKVSRITIATLDYQAYCRARSLTEKSSVSLKGTVLESLATLLDKYNEDAAKKWERFEDKGLQPAENPPPMPPVMPPKQVINEDITLANKGKVMGGGGFSISKADVAAKQKKDDENYLINLHQRMMQFNADKPISSSNVKLMERSPVDYNAVYLTCCVAAAFVLCGLIGLVLGVAFGSSL
jgi:hypothetical protein